MKHIAIIGCGNIGAAIAKGLLDTGMVNPGFLTLTRRNPEMLGEFADLGVEITADNAYAVFKADLVIVAVKPGQVRNVLGDCSFRAGQVLVSVAAGVSLEMLRAAAGAAEIHVFRAMPNTAIAVRQSMTCICHDTEDEQVRAQVCALFARLGTTALISESQMDAATVVAASGIAYAMRYISAAVQGAVAVGLPYRQAAEMICQTLSGAVTMLQKGGRHAEAEIEVVATPGGCTIAGLVAMERNGFSNAVVQGILESNRSLKK